MSRHARLVLAAASLIAVLGVGLVPITASSTVPAAPIAAPASIDLGEALASLLAEDADARRRAEAEASAELARRQAAADAQVSRARDKHVFVPASVGRPCGGDLPPCSKLDRENRAADPRLWNGGCYAPVGWIGSRAPNCPRARSTASGIWQIVRGTWNRFGGYLNAADAPPEVQLQKVRLLWAGGRGCAHWRAC